MKLLISLPLSDQMSFLVVRQMGCRYVNVITVLWLRLDNTITQVLVVDLMFDFVVSVSI